MTPTSDLEMFEQDRNENKKKIRRKVCFLQINKLNK